MATIRLVFLAIAFILQVALLWTLFTRRAASRPVLFTVLLAVYVLRSAVLFGLSQQIAHAVYASIYSGLSVLDVILQIALAIELSILMLRAGGRPLLPRAMLIPGFFLVAAGLTALVAWLLPAHSPVPADRGTIYTGFLFLELLAWSSTLHMVAWPRHLLGGLAAMGASTILSQCARSVSAFHRDAHGFLAWSYFSGIAYLVIVTFWIWTLRRDAVSPFGSPRPSDHTVCYAPGSV